MNEKKFFIAIGPPKTGTTWLHKNLKKHPQVSMPRDKEIRYFWAKETLGPNNLWTNLFGKHWHFNLKRKKFRIALKRHLSTLLKKRKLSLSDLRWDIRYFFGTQNDHWYKSLFHDEMLSGDITPIYCDLSERTIENIKALIPEAKIIISLRDPIEREWSRARMNLLKRKQKSSISAIPSEEVIEHFKDPVHHNSNDYVALVNSWKQYFGEEKVFVFFFDELKEAPQELMNKICLFLNIQPIKIDNLSRKVNEGVKEVISPDYLNALIDLNYPFLEKMEDYFQNEYVDRWMNKYKDQYQLLQSKRKG